MAFEPIEELGKMPNRDEKSIEQNTSPEEVRPLTQTVESEDIDIFATFNMLAKHAGKIKILAIISILIMASSYATYKTKVAKERYFRYQMEIGLHFNGINDKQYPNGTNFNPSDIVSPDVLKTVYDKYKLNAVNFQQFVNAFSASYKNIYRIPEKIQTPISEVKKGTLPKRYQLGSAVQIIKPSEIMIYMDVQSMNNSIKLLPADVLEAAVKDVPFVWSQKFQNQYLGLNISNPLKVIIFDELATMGYGDIYETLTQNLNLFIAGVERVKSRIDLSNVRSEKHDLTLEEAFFYVQNSLARQISAWYSVPQSFGVVKDEFKRKAYLENQHFDLLARQKLVMRSNEALNETLERIRNPQGSLNPGKEGSSRAVDAPAASPTIDDSLLTRIYKSGQSNQNINVTYVQKLTDKYLEGVEKVSSLEKEVTKIQRDIKSLNSNRDRIVGKKKEDLVKEIDFEYAKLIEEYKKWITICIDIAEENIEAESLKYGGIFTIVSPMSKIYINPSSSIALKKKYVTTRGLMIALGFFGFCLVLIVRESFIKYRQEHGNQ